MIKDFMLKNLFFEMVKFCTDKKRRSVFLIRGVLFLLILSLLSFGIFVDFSTLFEFSKSSAIYHTLLTLACFGVIEFITMLANTVFRHYKYRKEANYKFKLCENGHISLYLDLLASLFLKIILKHFKDIIFVLEDEKAKAVFSAIKEDNRLSFKIHGSDSKTQYFWFYRKFLREVEKDMNESIFFTAKIYHIVMLSNDDERVMAKLMIK